jgi:hypothetical protein
MVTFQKWATLFATAFLIATTFQPSQAQAHIQHELGVQGAFGVMPASIHIDPFYGVGWAASGGLQYNVLLPHIRINIGIGLMYQLRSFSQVTEETDDQGNITGKGLVGFQKENIGLPFTLGYRSPKNWFVNVVVAPTLPQTARSSYRSPQPQFDGYKSHYVSPNVGLEMGVQAGYRWELSEEWHLQLAAQWSSEVLTNGDNLPRYHPLVVTTGLHYQL